MTGHQIESFVGDLVAMAQATKRLPEVEAELASVKSENAGYLDIVQRLELKLMDAKNLEDTLRASIRDLEVARDDAELRFLEADDKLANTLDRLAQMGNIIRTVSDNLSPPKPQPVEVPQANVDPTAATDRTDFGADASQASASTDVDTIGSESASPPISAPSAPIGTGTESVASSYEAPPSSWASSSGQSELDPTAHGSDGSTQESVNAQSQPAKPSEPAATKPWWEQDVKHN